MADFHKMAEKRFAEVDENEKKQRPLVTKQFIIASDWSSVEFMIVVSEKLSWDSLFPQFETKQATGSERWQISTKWLEKDLQKLMKMRRTEFIC